MLSTALGAMLAASLALSVTVPVLPAYGQTRMEAENNADFDAAILASKKAMTSNPQEAYDQAKKADQYAQAVTNGPTIAAWLQAEALTRIGEPEAAGSLIARARRYMAQDDAKLAGDILLTEARALTALGDEGLALGSYQDAYKLFEEMGDGRKVALSLQGIARLYQKARRWDRAIDYYRKADEAFPDDKMLRYAAANNIAKILLEQERYDEAVEAFQENLDVAEEIGSPYFVAVANGLLAETHALAGDLPAARAALTTAKVHDDHEGAEMWAPYIEFTEAFVAHAEGDSERAGAHFDALFEDYDFVEPAPTYRSAHRAATEHYEEVGKPSLALAHHRAFKAIDDEGLAVAARNNFDLLSAEFETANKQVEIERLEREQLEARIDATAQKTQLRNALYAVALCGAAIILALLLLYLRQMAKGRQKLAATNDALVRASKEKDEFLANTSHELRTPLNGIMGFTEVLIDQGHVSGEGLEIARIIEKSAKYQLNTVNDILDVAKFEAGHFLTETAPCDLADTLTHVATVQRSIAAAKDVSVTIDIEEGFPCYVTDEELVRRAATNLIGNAVKFTSRGAVAITVCTIPAGGFSLSVKDTGMGIPADQIDKIFGAFSQIEGQRRAQYGGTGLGLAYVRNVAKALGGEVEVESKVGYGSTFTMTIPASEAPPMASAEKPVRAPKAARWTVTGLRDVPRGDSGEVDLSQLRILVAEDQKTNQLLFTAMLGPVVAHIDIAEDGHLAVQMVQEDAYDIILMDNQMPTMNGREACQEIKALPGIGDIPIIGVTADAVPSVKEGLIEAGMASIVDKPMSKDRLFAAITTAFGPSQPSTDHSANVA